MDEATPSIAPQPSAVIAPATSQAQRQAMGRAVRVLAQQAAIKEAKCGLQSQGLKLSRSLHREIVVMAEEIVLADAQCRAKIIAEAKAIVADREAEGYFRPRRRSVRKVPELRTLAEQQARQCGGNGQ
jgi:hypothetical protein